MDSITHIAIGACIGELTLGKKIGKKALVIGAMAHSLPDIDAVASLWTDTAENLLAHRGFTHSLLFVVLAAFVLSLAADRWHRRHAVTLKEWLFFFSIVIPLHILLDSFNAYGTGWFEPFSHARISFDILFVADPFFSLFPGIAFALLLFVRSWHPHRRYWAGIALSISLVYLGYAMVNKRIIHSEVRDLLTRQHIPYQRYFTTPTPLNNWLWYAVAEADSGYYIGYRSVFDSQEAPMEVTWFPRNEKLLKDMDDHEELQHLLRFSQGYYTVEMHDGSLRFNDLRFGQRVGWRDPKAEFVFQFYLQHPQDNKLVIQRGRFAGWNLESTRSLIHRIRGLPIPGA